MISNSFSNQNIRQAFRHVKEIVVCAQNASWVYLCTHTYTYVYTFMRMDLGRYVYVWVCVWGSLRCYRAIVLQWFDVISSLSRPTTHFRLDTDQCFDRIYHQFYFTLSHSLSIYLFLSPSAFLFNFHLSIFCSNGIKKLILIFNAHPSQSTHVHFFLTVYNVIILYCSHQGYAL